MNIIVVETEEEGIEVANSTNLSCSIVEVVDMGDNRVEVVVESYDMSVGPYVSKEASYMFWLHPHSYRWLAIQARMGNYLLGALLYRGDI